MYLLIFIYKFFLYNIHSTRPNVIHPLYPLHWAISFQLVCSLSNADDWQEIEAFAETNEEMLRKYIELENGVPSHDTIQRVMAIINPEILQELQVMWNELLTQLSHQQNGVNA